jgi:hypothetical protein
LQLSASNEGYEKDVSFTLGSKEAWFRAASLRKKQIRKRRIPIAVATE